METLISSLDCLKDRGYEFAVLLKRPNANLEAIYSDSVDQEAQMLLENAMRVTPRATAPFSIKSQQNGRHPPRTQNLLLSNKAQVDSYFQSVFCVINQQRCKAIAKAWIKVVEPKKQSKYPYIKGEASKPSWWPNDVVHRGSDHLKKPERIRLLVAILSQHLPSLDDSKLFLKLKRSTSSLPISEDPYQQWALEDAYKVCWALCTGQEAVIALDLRYALPQELDGNSSKKNEGFEDTLVLGRNEPASFTKFSGPGNTPLPSSRSSYGEPSLEQTHETAPVFPDTLEFPVSDESEQNVDKRPFAQQVYEFSEHFYLDELASSVLNQEAVFVGNHRSPF
ncbi:LAQU0S25e00540g1_1 [Lachancea quebecensis]|uniref:LAQU0S25e00540g1_1 n=1 Tax=Lachancea quebecensis TaxID=1654605 RepID=A0A0P1L3S1_9SACH|nr:LAQU0S25e00540g1_1 [Lachancea quebecensis]